MLEFFSSIVLILLHFLAVTSFFFADIVNLLLDIPQGLHLQFECGRYAFLFLFQILRESLLGFFHIHELVVLLRANVARNHLCDFICDVDRYRVAVDVHTLQRAVAAQSLHKSEACSRTEVVRHQVKFYQVCVLFQRFGNGFTSLVVDVVIAQVQIGQRAILEESVCNLARSLVAELVVTCIQYFDLRDVGKTFSEEGAMLVSKLAVVQAQAFNVALL